MIGQFKLTRMTEIWPTSRKREQGKKNGTIAPLTIAKEIDPTRRSSRSCVMYVYLLRTLLIHISKTKLLVRKESESGRFANWTEEDLQKIIDNKDSKQNKAVIEKSVRKIRWYCESKEYVFSEVEKYNDSELSSLLRTFYAEVRTKSGEYNYSFLHSQLVYQ